VTATTGSRRHGAFGVSRRTFYEWIQRGNAEHPTRRTTDQLHGFAHAIAIAIDIAEVRLGSSGMGSMRNAHDEAWRSSPRPSKSKVTV